MTIPSQINNLEDEKSNDKDTFNLFFKVIYITLHCLYRVVLYRHNMQEQHR